MPAVKISRKYAYATLLTRQSYLPGVIILAHTLGKNESKYPLIVLYTPNLPHNAVKALEMEASKTAIIPQQCDFLLPPSGIKMTLIADRFEDTWTKLRVFELFGYDAVCYLDADMAIFGNMDSVFEYEMDLPPDWMAANHACVCNLDSDPWADEDWTPENCAYTPLSHPKALVEPIQPRPDSPATHHLLNSGLFLFHPAEELWKKMLALFNSTPLLSKFLFPDQDFLALFFGGKWVSVGWQYNALKTMRYWHPGIWRDEEVICLHYIVDKPWKKRVGEDGTAGYLGRDGATHQWWWNAYQDWESERALDFCGGAKVMDVVRGEVAAVDVTPKRVTMNCKE